MTHHIFLLMIFYLLLRLMEKIIFKLLYFVPIMCDYEFLRTQINYSNANNILARF